MLLFRHGPALRVAADHHRRADAQDRSAYHPGGPRRVHHHGREEDQGRRAHSGPETWRAQRKGLAASCKGLGRCAVTRTNEVRGHQPKMGGN